VWVGVSDAINDTANVAPFRLMTSFCMPCLMGCQEICAKGKEFNLFCLVRCNGLKMYLCCTKVSRIKRKYI
jgi:hypothetical protein